MVAGDLVNTASRLQSVAPPGTVLVGEATAAGGIAGDRLRAGRRAGAQGQGRPGPGLARAARRRGARRPQSGGDARGAVRRPRRRAAPAQGPVPRHRARAAGAARLGHRAGRHRQDAARLGVPQVRRRARRRVWWHDGRSPGLRRGDQLLGARRDGPRGGPGCSRPTTSRRPGPRWPRPSRRTSPTRRSGAGSSRRCWRCSGSTRAPSGRRSCSRAWRTFFERLAATAPVVMVFEDFHFADTGLLDFVDHLLEWIRARADLRRHAGATGAARAAARTGAPASGASRRSTSSRCPAEAMRELLGRPRAGPPGDAPPGRSSPAPTGSRCTPSRRCGCCSPRAGSTLDGGVYRPIGDLARWPSPRR